MGLAACTPVVELAGVSESAIDGEVIGPGPGGVYTTGCEATCNGAGVICGTVTDPANGSICCCIGGCTWWGPTCAAGVANGTIGPGESPAGGGTYTASCEAACNGAGVTCGTVANAQGQTCCCIGSCPWWGETCAAGVASGQIGPGAAPGPGGGVYTAACEAACNGAGVTCGTVANAQGQTCCCIGTCPENAAACAAGVGAGVIGPGVIF